MGNRIAGDLKKQYEGVFRTLRAIAGAYPEAGWRRPHGDDYLIPCRILYHIALCIRYHILAGFEDPAYYDTLPWGRWNLAGVEDLPGMDEFKQYMEGILSQAETEISKLDDGALMLPPEEGRAWAGGTRLAVHMYLMREFSDHIGELNAMMLQDGAADTVWFV
jgi:hypothetical protein